MRAANVFYNTGCSNGSLSVSYVDGYRFESYPRNHVQTMTLNWLFTSPYSQTVLRCGLVIIGV